MITESPLQFHPDKSLSGKEASEGAWLLLRLCGKRRERRLPQNQGEQLFHELPYNMPLHLQLFFVKTM